LLVKPVQYKSILIIIYSPYKFEAPWNAWEFAYHILHKEANLVILSMAWLTREDPRSFSRSPRDPDMETLRYWVTRLEPVIRAETEGEIIVVMANRSGNEEDAVYAGTSCVLGIQDGEVKVYGILGRGEKELLIVDTERRPQAKLISQPNSAASTVSNASAVDTTFSKESNESALSEDTVHSPGVGSFGRSMADTMTPISPVDAFASHAYFASREKEQEIPREELKSSIPEATFTPPLPDSPTFRRPSSPKSRNASRTRMVDEQYTAPVSHDLAMKEGYMPNFMDSPQHKAKAVSPLPSVLHSASVAPERQHVSLTNKSFGARSQHSVPRPQSAVW
jgi:protein N-terminal amidase